MEWVQYRIGCPQCKAEIVPLEVRVSDDYTLKFEGWCEKCEVYVENNTSFFELHVQTTDAIRARHAHEYLHRGPVGVC